MTKWLAALLLLFLGTAAFPQTFPPLTGRVVDNAHLLSSAEVVDLTSKSAALEAQSGRQFVVATVPSLQGHTIEDYGYKLLRSWGIGRKGVDDGVILIVAPNEHKVRIETGYGARVFLTDAVSSVIIREAILPHFKRNPPDYGGGIEEGTDQIIKQMSLPPEEAARNAAAAEQAQHQRQVSGTVLPAAFWFMIAGFLLLSMFRRSAGRRYRTRHGGISPWVILWGLNALSNSGRRGGWGGGSWGGGSSWGGGGGWSGGGGFSGGGGSGGGGGASGSW